MHSSHSLHNDLSITIFPTAAILNFRPYLASEMHFLSSKIEYVQADYGFYCNLIEPLAKFKTRDSLRLRCARLEELNRMFEMPICSACSKRSEAVADAPLKNVVYQARHFECSEAIPVLQEAL